MLGRIRLDFMQNDCGLMQPKPITHASAAIEHCSEVVPVFTILLFGQRPLDSLTQEVDVLLAYARASGTPPGMAPMWGTRGCRCVVGRCLGWLPPSLRSRLNRFSVSPGRMCNPTILVEKPCVAEGSFGEKGERDVRSSNHVLYQAWHAFRNCAGGDGAALDCRAGACRGDRRLRHRRLRDDGNGL